MAGVARRVARDPPELSERKLEELNKFVRRWVARYLTPLDPSTIVSFDTWLENTNYTPNRRRQLREVYESLLKVDGHPGQRHYQKVKCFCKDESYLSYKHVRAIYARGDELKVVLGPIFKHIEHVLYNRPEFVKKIPVGQRAKYIKDQLSGFKQYAATDYTAFEGAFTAPLIRAVEMELYAYMLQYVPGSSFYLALIESVLTGNNVCTFKNLRVIIPASRMSGEMNTSLGNGFVNLMVWKYLNFNLKNEEVCVVEGDDLLGGFSRQAPSPKEYEALGFRVKMELFDRVGDASFCGLVFDEDDMVSIADPTKILLNVGWTKIDYVNASHRTRRGLLRAKGYSMLYSFSGAPIIQSLALYLIRVTEGYKIKIPSTWTNWERSKFSESGKEKYVKFNTRMLMERIFGYTVFEQRQIEEYFDSKNEISPIWHPLILDHFSVDQVDYYNRFVSPRLPGSDYMPSQVPIETSVQFETSVKQIQCLEKPSNENQNKNKNKENHERVLRLRKAAVKAPLFQ